MKEHLSDLFGLDRNAMNNGLSTTLNADESVARGCALQSAMLSTRFKVKAVNIFEAVSYPVQLCWDQPSGDAMEVDEGAADAEAEQEQESVLSSAATSVVMFKKNDETPKIRRVTFKRADPFTITARYDDAAAADLPPGVDHFIGTFTVQPAESEACVPNIRVNIKHDQHGLLKCVSAQQMEEIKEENKDEAPAEGKDGEDKDAEGKAEPPTEGKDAEGAAEPPKKKRYRKVPVSVGATLPGMVVEELTAARETEAAMAAQDKLIEETNDAKNEVETHIYATRDKMFEEFAPFCTDAEKEAVEAGLVAAEDWLYDEGYDCEKSVYVDKLAELRRLSHPIAARKTESQTRDGAVRSMRDAIDKYRQWLSSSVTDDKFAHITDAERDIVRAACTEDEAWLFEQMEAQAQCPQHVDPVLKTSHISDRHRQLVDKCRPVLTKPKPQPKPESKPAADTKESAADKGAGEPAEGDAEAPSEPAPEAGADGEAGAKEEPEPMETEDAAGTQD